MKKLLIAVLVVAGAALAQSRVDVFSPENVAVTDVTFRPVGDGGAVVQACGTATSDDGGVTRQYCAVFVPRTAAQNVQGANALNTGVRVLLSDLRAGDAGL